MVYRFRPMNEAQIAQSANLLSRGLGTEQSSTNPTYTYEQYQDWLLRALNDGKITRREWKDLQKQAGFGGRKARKAFNAGGTTWANYFKTQVKPRVTAKSYISRDPTTGKVVIVSQWDTTTFNPEAYESAYYKGTNPTKLASDYNKALVDARKNATIVYKQRPNGQWGYYTSYKVGDFDIQDLDATDADWFKAEDARRNSAQLRAYGQDVDNYSNQFNEFKDTTGMKLLEGIKFDTSDVKKWNQLGDSDEDKAKKETIKQNVQNALIQYYKDLAAPGGRFSWDSGVKADAWWKNMMDYYKDKNIAWLTPLSWQDTSRYADYQKLGTNPTSTGVKGDLIDFSYKQGGLLRARKLARGGRMIPIAGWGASLGRYFGWNPLIGEGLDLVTDFVPWAGTLNRSSSGDYGEIGSAGWWAKTAGSLATDFLGPFGKGVKAGAQAIKAVKFAKSAATVFKDSGKLLTGLNRVSKVQKEWQAYLKAVSDIDKLTKAPKAGGQKLINLAKSKKALEEAIKRNGISSKYLEAVTKHSESLINKKTETLPTFKEAWEIAKANSKVERAGKVARTLKYATRVGSHQAMRTNAPWGSSSQQDQSQQPPTETPDQDTPVSAQDTPVIASDQPETQPAQPAWLVNPTESRYSAQVTFNRV